MALPIDLGEIIVPVLIIFYAYYDPRVRNAIIRLLEGLTKWVEKRAKNR